MKQLKGRMLAIAVGNSDLSIEMSHKYREIYAEQGYELPEFNPHGFRPGKKSLPINRLGLPGSELKKSLAWIESLKPATASCSCNNLAAEMDIDGFKKCRERREYYVGRMLENKTAIVEAMKSEGGINGILGAVAGVVPHMIAVAWIGHKFDAACDAAEVKKKQPTPRPRRQSTQRRQNGRRPYTGWRGLGNEGPSIEMGPFVSTIRHLTFHVWAHREGAWKWSIDQLAKRFHLFNGRTILGVSTGGNTVEQVVEYAASKGIVFSDVVVRPNVEKLREVVTWVPMLELLSPGTAAPEEVVFSCHAKGQKYTDETYTRNWTHLMWRSCLDYWPLVESKLEHSLMVGSFREFGLLGKWNDWAYSGTFYWWRLAEIGKRDWRNVDQWFAGTESWPGKLCDPRETACLFLNNNTRLYVDEYWRDTVWPEWREWVKENDAHRSL